MVVSENQESINHCPVRPILNTLIYAVIIEKRADRGILLTLNWAKTELPVHVLKAAILHHQNENNNKQKHEDFLQRLFMTATIKEKNCKISEG